jgi:hypothetical protein
MLETHRMKKLLEFLLPICFHEWEIEEKIRMFRPEFIKYEVNGKQLPIGHKYTLLCKKCGEMKTYHDY